MERKNKEKFRVILILLVLGIIIYCIITLYEMYMPYFRGENKYSELQEMARGEGVSAEQPDGRNESSDLPGRDAGNSQYEGDGENSNHSNSTGEEGTARNTNVRSPVNFDPLKDINSDIVAWIWFEEPSEIDYPIVQGRDNQEYLTRTFDADGHKYGTIFMDVDNSPDFTDRNTFIYGHHMANGSMFAGLLDYLDKSYYDKHPYFTIETVSGKILTYQVCSVEITAENTLSYRWQYETEESWEEYRTYIMNNAEYSTGVTLEADSRLVSLSTCLNTTTSQRVLLHGVLVAEV